MKEYKQHTIPNVLKRLALAFKTEITNRRVEIPEKFGKGYCKGYIFNEYIRMLIVDYELHEELVIENPDINTLERIILFKFQNILPKTAIVSTEKPPKAVPTVLIATSRINTDITIPIHTSTAAINIEVDAGYLNRLFEFSEKSPVLQSLLQNTQPLLFEQMIYPALQKIVDEILTESVNETFELFFMKIKAEELVCRLLMTLEKREEKHLYALNNHDIQAIYVVKEQMLAQLQTPPLIKELAVGANMSSSKLKRLFKQIFGNSIFSYYQEFRMQEAARLLKEEKLSVSEVGYRLGFSNMSHFSRVFEAHLGMKPKQFSRS